MKQKKIISMIGALVLIISAVVLITGCPQPNSGSNKGDKNNVKGLLGVTSTGSAADSVKGTTWELDVESFPIQLPQNPMPQTEAPVLVFAEKGNVVSIKNSSLEIDIATYKIEDKTVIFDLSTVFDVCKTMTVDKLIDMGKKVLPIAIKELESAIEKEKNENIKVEMKEALKKMKEFLEELKNPTQELKETLQPMVDQIKEKAKNLELKYNQIKGTLNTDNSKLEFDDPDGGKIVLKKRK